MQRIFGSSKQSLPKQSVSDVISKTDAHVNSVDAKINKLDIELAKFRDQMAKMRDGPAKDSVKQRAIRLLRQKKAYEAQRDQLAQQSFNLEQTSMVSESLKTSMATVEAMKIASRELNTQYKKFNIDTIERLRDKMEDQMADINEIQQVLSQTYGLDDEVDESMLEAELEGLADLDFLESQTIDANPNVSEPTNVTADDALGLLDLPDLSAPNNNVGSSTNPKIPASGNIPSLQQPLQQYP